MARQPLAYFALEEGTAGILDDAYVNVKHQAWRRAVFVARVASACTLNVSGRKFNEVLAGRRRVNHPLTTTHVIFGNDFLTEMSKVLTEARAIRIKGRSFLAVVLTPELPVADWLARLEDLAARSAGFFLTRPVVLDIAELDITRVELRDLIDELAARNVRIMGIEGGRPSLFDSTMPPQLKGGLEGPEIEVPKAEAAARATAASETPAAKPAHSFEAHGSASLVLREPVRSGQTVIFPEGDVTVLGSVASGAEVIAGGSIHVYGTLRGRALAGTSGNPSARIFCRKLEAELLAVDGIYKTAEDLPPEVLGKPAHLWLDGESIVAETIA